jgi:hypothetical protein
MASGDTFRIKVYVKDQSASTLRQYLTQDYTDAQTSPAIYISPVLTKEFKVTIQKTAGTNRSVNWQTIEVT